MTLKNTTILLAASVATLMGASAALAAGQCSAYPKAKTDKVESSDLEKTFGAVPKPAKELRFAYVTKTLINEFWQDVAAGVKDEAGKYNIKVDVQAAKDESSMIEQLNLAQTMLSQKPDALLLSPQSDSNLAPVIKAAREANIPTIIIDDARTDGASSYIGTDQVAIGGKAADYLGERFKDGGKVAQIEGAAGSPNARARIKGFQEGLKKYPKLQLVASQPGNWDRLVALNATSNILRQNPTSLASMPTMTAWRSASSKPFARAARWRRLPSSARMASAKPRSRSARRKWRLRLPNSPSRKASLAYRWRCA